MSKTRTGQVREREALEILEEAVLLLKSLPLSAWIGYLAGAGLWVIAFLWFWAHATWFAPSAGVLLLHALGLTFAFGFLKLGQASLCGHLMGARMGNVSEAWGSRRCIQIFTTELSGHAAGILLIPLSALLTFPLAWVFAWFQGRSVLAGTQRHPPSLSDLRQLALAQPKQTHFALLYLSIFALVVLVNVGFACALIPWAANEWLGVDTFSAYGGTSFLNTTFLAAVTLVSWLVLDPLVKAYFTLRVFYGRSMTTGDDLLVALRRVPARKSVLVVVLFCLLAGLGPKNAHAEALAPSPAAEALREPKPIDPKQLGAQIERTLQADEFAWKLRPKKAIQAERDENGPVEALFLEGFRAIGRAFHWVDERWTAFKNWWRNLWPKSEPDEKETSSASGGPNPAVIADIVLWGLAALLLAAIIYLIVIAIRQRPVERLKTLATGSAGTVPNLQDESVHAALLPWQEWLALARAKRAQGEWRLALRALFLAQLARLAEEGAFALARHKTNLEYEREFRRRLPGTVERHGAFRERRLLFESVWYGDRTVDENTVDPWIKELGGDA